MNTRPGSVVHGLLALASLLATATGATAGLPAGQDLVLSEVFYDRDSASDDGYEWVELYNRGNSTIVLTGTHSLGWGGSDYTGGQLDLVGSIGPGETFVVGGPTSDATNFSPVLDQAVDLDPDLQNSGATADGIALFDLPSSSVTTSTVPIDAVIYGGTNTNNLIDETGTAPAPDVGDAPDGESIARDEQGWSIRTTPTPNFTALPGSLLLSEIFYDRASASDDDYEWVELYNRGNSTIVLTGTHSLGWGGSDYTGGQLDLVGSIDPGETFVVGGPLSDATNFSPVLDQAVDLDPDLQNSGATADGIALFDLPSSSVTASTVPIDAVVYGETNTNGLIDQTGVAAVPDVGDALDGESIARDGDGWFIQTTPTPNATALPPDLVLSEVFYDRDSASDDGYEWVELYNRGNSTIVLTGTHSLGWGGSDYTTNQLDLVGSIGPGETFVVGGPSCDGTNNNPGLDQAVDLDGDLQNSGATADGVALFALPASSVTASTVPMDAVIYGETNTSDLIDESGLALAPDVGDAPDGESIARDDGSWFIQVTPTPNVTALTGPPSSSVFRDTFECGNTSRWPIIVP